MVLSACVALPARADTAQNAFVIVEGDGVVRLDGRNFAVGADGEVTIRAQPGWVLDTPASVKLVSTKPIRYMAHDTSGEGSVVGEISGLRATFITPAGDPINAPVDSGEGQNEFTFSTAPTGMLTIHLKVKLEPALSDAEAPEGTFSIEDIGGSVKEWAAENPNGTAVYSSGHYTATVTFRGLPASNSDFGKKTVTFSVADVTITQTFEVFFPKNGTNHPTCGTCAGCPNWFFYWGQLRPDNNIVVYNPRIVFGDLGETPAMTKWSYSIPHNKTYVEIGSSASEKFSMYTSLEEFSGIDLFLATCFHENVHVRQIKEADALCPQSNGNDCFRYGWSWGQFAHNHWSKGPDGEWGVAGLDDDRNGIIDDADPNPTFEPGYGDDETLSRSKIDDRSRDWPIEKPMPSPDFEAVPEESEAVNETDAAIDEDQYALLDWGNPGKQHRSAHYDD